MKKQHTAGLGNVEEGRIAERLLAQPKKKKRVRKRPTLGPQYKGVN